MKFLIIAISCFHFPNLVVAQELPPEIPIGIEKLIEVVMEGEQLPSQFSNPPNSILLEPQNLVLHENKANSYMAIVRFQVYSSDMKQSLMLCSGVLLAEDIVATARHCLDIATDEAIGFILLDSYQKGDIKKPNAKTWALVQSVLDVCLPGWCRANGDQLKTSQPNYYSGDYFLTNWAAASHDIVLLKLDRALTDVVPFSIHPKGAPLPTEQLRVAGFPINANELVSFEVPVKHVSDNKCELSRSNLGSFAFTSCMIAVGMSGGPLFYEKDGVPYLVGIASNIIYSPDGNSKELYVYSVFPDSLVYQKFFDFNFRPKFIFTK